MDIIDILPVNNIAYEFHAHAHMFLTHLVEKYPVYAEVALRCPGYKILDNSLVELGGAVSLDRVLEAAKKIDADEIILPDVYKKGPETVKAVQDAIAELREKYPNGKWPYRLMAVAHGRNEKEWVKCYMQLLEIPEVNVIGIPKVLATMHPQGRPYFVNTYCDLLAKPHHLLGLWYSFEELDHYKSPKDIRSCDTVLRAFMAVHNLPLRSVRPDGYTLNLETATVDLSRMYQVKKYD